MMKYQISPFEPQLSQSIGKGVRQDLIRALVREEIDRENRTKTNDTFLRLIKLYRNDSESLRVDDTSVVGLKSGRSFDVVLPGGPILVELGGKFIVSVIGSDGNSGWSSSLELYMDNESSPFITVAASRTIGATSYTGQFSLMGKRYVVPSSDHRLFAGKHIITPKLRNANTLINSGGNQSVTGYFINLFDVGFDERVEIITTSNDPPD